MTAPQHPLVELAQGALARLADVPRFGASSLGSAEELHQAWVRAPVSVAIGGALPARTELFNYLCGKTVLDPNGRPIGCAALRIRRGKQTRFKAVRDDGSTEEHVLPSEQADDDALRHRAAAARADVEERKLALERVERGLPRIVRERPRGFFIWLWPLWWLFTHWQRRKHADRRFSAIAYEQARDALTLADQELEASISRIRVERGRFFESLRALSSGPPLGGNVREVFLELGDGPLPEGVDLIELTRPQATELVDAILLVEHDTFYAPHTAEGDAPKVGTIKDTIPDLLALLGRARALALARRARYELEPALKALDEDISDTEESFRVRIERLEAMQIVDDEEFARAELAKIKPMVSKNIPGVLEQAAGHLVRQLELLGKEWTTVIGMTQTNDQLKHTVQRIETSAPVDAKRIADEVRMLVIGGASGSAHELLPGLLATLKPHGLDEPPPRNAPELAPIDMLPSLTNMSSSKLSVSGGLTGLFRSFETRRTEVHAKAESRIQHMQQVGASEMLDIEPKVRATIEQALYAQLHAAIGRQVAWLDKTLVAERKAVAAEGAALAPLARMRDRLRHDLNKLIEGIDQIERESPGLAAAAAPSTSTV